MELYKRSAVKKNKQHFFIALIQLDFSEVYPFFKNIGKNKYKTILITVLLPYILQITGVYTLIFYSAYLCISDEPGNAVERVCC